jgi:tetratricopeptide (TPR) repeat protein
MDAVRFGRWISERRRAAGWRSQKAFVEMAQQDAFLRTYNISEDFLSRLEAGRLAHPFRKGIRRRVLALAGQLCKTPRELRSYMQAAELSDLSPEETDYVNHLAQQLASRRASTILFLPPRPVRLLGRTDQVNQLKYTLSTLETGICAVTGMPGVGKSALAAEAVHQLASNERERLRLFPDGIATFSGIGRRGMQGLIALLQDIVAVFSPATTLSSQVTHTLLMNSKETPSPSMNARVVHLRSDDSNRTAAKGKASRQEMLEADLAGAIDRVRQVLAGKRILLVLDDVDAQFPLRQACEALLAQEQISGSGSISGRNAGHASRMVLITSRYSPAPALVRHHLHLEPLEPSAALELFIALTGHTLSIDEQTHVERICASVGYLPLAIEMAATAATVAGIPLSLLAERVVNSPLDALLDSEGEVRSRLAQAFASFDPQMQQRFALLSTLGTQAFALETAAALRSIPPDINKFEIYKTPANGQHLPEHRLVLFNTASQGQQQVAQSRFDLSSADLASTAADLAQFVRHSLLEIVPNNSPTTLQGNINNPDRNEASYQLHPLLYAHAMSHLEQLEPEIVQVAQHNLQSYALAYAELYSGDVPKLERERAFLLAMLSRIWDQQQYPLVVHFLGKIANILGRLNYEEGKRLLHWGILASQQTQDQFHLACFLCYLGKLHIHHGRLKQARTSFEQSIALSEALPPDSASNYLAGVFTDLAHIAHILGDVGAARGYTDTYVKRALETSDAFNSAIALFFRAFYARLDGDLDKAYHDISLSRSLLLKCKSEHPLEEYSFGLSVLAELARVQGDYEHSRQYIEAQLQLAQTSYPLYMTADTLYDQACFALQQGMREDAQLLVKRLLDLANQIGTPHLHTRALTLLQQIYAQTNSTTA